DVPVLRCPCSDRSCHRPSWFTYPFGSASIFLGSGRLLAGRCTRLQSRALRHFLELGVGWHDSRFCGAFTVEPEAIGSVSKKYHLDFPPTLPLLIFFWFVC